MRAIALSAAVVAVLVMSGCGGSKTASPAPTDTTPTTTSPQPVAQPAPKPKPTKPPRIYTKRELPKLVLQPKDAPADMRFLPSESGPKTLEQMGLILPRQIDEMRNYGFLAARDAIFVTRAPGSDRRVAQRVWLMRTPKFASRWFAADEGRSRRSRLRAGHPGEAGGGVVGSHGPGSRRRGDHAFVPPRQRGVRRHLVQRHGRPRSRPRSCRRACCVSPGTEGLTLQTIGRGRSHMSRVTRPTSESPWNPT